MGSTCSCRGRHRQVRPGRGEQSLDLAGPPVQRHPCHRRRAGAAPASRAQEAIANGKLMAADDSAGPATPLAGAASRRGTTANAVAPRAALDQPWTPLVPTGHRYRSQCPALLLHRPRADGLVQDQVTPVAIQYVIEIGQPWVCEGQVRCTHVGEDIAVLDQPDRGRSGRLWRRVMTGLDPRSWTRDLVVTRRAAA